MMSSRHLHWAWYALWCLACAAGVGGLLAYLTSWPLGILSGVVTACFILLTLLSDDRPGPELDDEDLAAELLTGVKYSNHPGNIFKTD